MSIFTMKMIFGIRRYLQIKEKQIVDASICREVSLMQRKQDKDTLIKLQASSSAIERKNKMQSPDSKHLQVP